MTNLQLDWVALLIFTLVLFPEKCLLGEVREEIGVQLGCTWVHTGGIAVMPNVWNVSSGKKSLRRLRALQGAGFLSFGREGMKEF